MTNAEVSEPVNRRDFFRMAMGITVAASATGTAAAQENGTEAGEGNATSGGGNQSNSSSGSRTTEVAVGPGGQLVFEPAEVQIEAGGTVRWVWESGGHNVVPESGDWGHESIENAGFTYEHTFKQAGENPYVCQPHASTGMTGTVVVGSSGGSGGSGGAKQGPDPEDMGVPIRPHYAGIVSVAVMILSTGLVLYALKYGESPHSSGRSRQYESGRTLTLRSSIRL